MTLKRARSSSLMGIRSLTTRSPLSPSPPKRCSKQCRMTSNAWSDKELAIDRMMETSDGTVITQFRLTETHSGTYKSVPATGARVTFSTCNILAFGDDGKIIAEEAYYDDLQTMLKLGAVRHTGGG
jgi:hypothetical protein